VSAMDITDIERAIDQVTRLQRRLIEAAAKSGRDRSIALNRAQLSFEALALAMGREVKEIEHA
jgi:hypothetical protein